jgi:hypothetical protein
MPGILFSQMTPPPGQEAEFHDWYETEHIPVRLAIPGFLRASRYRSVEEPTHFLAVYELADLAVLDTPEYQRVKQEPSERTRAMLSSVSGFTRFTCAELSVRGATDRGADYLSVVAFDVPEPEVPEFDDWYATEHETLLLGAPDWRAIRRYGVVSGDGGDWNRLALHELASLDVMDSPERAAARSAPMRNALAAREWFEQSGRWLYERISVFSAPLRLE